MRRKAFTLIEMVVVVCIIALLVAIIVPSLGQARSLARMAVCANNLHELGHGIGLARLAGGGLPSREAFPASEWPGIPSAQESSQRVFHCPEAPDTGSDIGTWTVHTNQATSNLGSSNPTEYPFENGVNCIVTAGPAPAVSGMSNVPAVAAGHTRYRLDDGYSRDINDMVFDRDNTTNVMTLVSDHFDGTANGELSLYHFGQPYPDWAPMGNQSFCKPQGSSFVMAGGATNYAINAVVGVQSVATDTVILLDYDQIKANDSTDVPMIDHLKKSSRHLGKINVMYGDFSVRASWGASLNKVENPGPWSPAQD